jgi:hypothetical protein
VEERHARHYEVRLDDGTRAEMSLLTDKGITFASGQTSGRRGKETVL